MAVADTFELDCPGCDFKLEVDRGFAGGVCRCSNCGTLMTVPADPSREKAEKLIRPDRPDSPGRKKSSAKTTPDKAASRPIRPDSPVSRPTAPSPADPSSTHVKSAGDGQVPVSAAAADESGSVVLDENTFVTASGKIVKVNLSHIVTAKTKRKIAKATTAGAVIAVMVAVVAACVVGIIMLVSTDQVETKKIDRAGAIGYDPDANPFILTTPNIMALSMIDQTVIMLDSSIVGREWISLVADAIYVGTRESGDLSYQLLVATDAGPVKYPGQPLPVRSVKEREELRQLLTGATPLGQADIVNMISQVIADKPALIILITQQQLTSTQLNALRSSLKEAGDSVQFDVVMMNDEDPGLVQLVEEHNGRHVTIPVRRLGSWFREANLDENLMPNP